RRLTAPTPTPTPTLTPRNRATAPLGRVMLGPNWKPRNRRICSPPASPIARRWTRLASLLLAGLLLAIDASHDARLLPPPRVRPVAGRPAGRAARLLVRLRRRTAAEPRHPQVLRLHVGAPGPRARWNAGRSD